jgi:hypothetical protein
LDEPLGATIATMVLPLRLKSLAKPLMLASAA